MKPSFWSRPFELSFKDVLAVAFSCTFLYFCWRATANKDALAVVQTLIPLMGIILGGYFVQESAAMWFYRSQGGQQYPGGYSGGVYMPLVTPAQSTGIAPEAEAPASSPEKPTI